MHFVDKLIARKTINVLLRAGYTVSVNDGEETVLKDSTDIKAIFAAMDSTEEDYLIARKPDSSGGWVRFIYGNEPGAVINDYSTNLEKVLEPVNSFAERFQ
jgi:hypothetical protein